MRKHCTPLDSTIMKYEEFITKFNKQVFSINYDKQLALAIDVCKKLYFYYVDFSEKYQWGDKGVLLDAISIVEQSKTNDIKQSLIDKTLNQLDTITPDMDDFGSDELGSYALNACVAVYNSVQFIGDKLPKHIYDIGICLTDTIDFKIQEQQTLTEQEIDNNPLMIEARKYLIDKSM
jgi:uncharacterized protein YjaG (DUF416 family)